MKTRLSDELTILTTRLMMCGSKREIIHLSGEFGKLIERVIAQENNMYTTPDKSVTATIKFTKEEVANMAKTFKKEFIANGLVARVIKRESGKNSFLYEIRYRRNGYNISASSTDLNEAKRKFLFMTLPSEIVKYQTRTLTNNQLPTTFTSFGLYFFEKKREKTVTPETYRTDFGRFKKYLVPHFGETPLPKINLIMCQNLIDQAVDEEKFKTAAELCSLMNLIFKYAVDNHLISHSPSTAVVFEGYERESGSALTLEEENTLFCGLTEPYYDIAVALLLYCGLRPNELKTAEIDGDFIKAVNSKRKKQKKTNGKGSKEFKWIPIIDRLKPFLTNGIPPFPSPQLLRRRIKAILPNHKLYDCRTTFETRCRAFNLEENALKLIMGQSLGVLGNAYTDTEKLKPYLLQEGQKLNKW